MLPCNIGDTVYLVEDFNEYWDEGVYYKTKYGEVKIVNHIVEAFIIDEDGVSIAEWNHDGCNKIGTYHNLTTEKYGECKVFFSENEAIEFIASIIK